VGQLVAYQVSRSTSCIFNLREQEGGSYYYNKFSRFKDGHKKVLLWSDMKREPLSLGLLRLKELDHCEFVRVA